eukprot:gene7669-15699_t
MLHPAITGQCSTIFSSRPHQQAKVDSLGGIIVERIHLKPPIITSYSQALTHIYPNNSATKKSRIFIMGFISPVPDSVVEDTHPANSEAETTTLVLVSVEEDTHPANAEAEVEDMHPAIVDQNPTQTSPLPISGLVSHSSKPDITASSLRTSVPFLEARHHRFQSPD